MIKAVVFDLDGVIYFTQTLWSKEFSRQHKIPLSQLDEFFENEFKDCLIGKQDTRKVLEGYIKKYNWPVSVDKILNSWFGYGEIDMRIITLIHELKQKGIKCILCTNNESYRVDYFRKAHGFETLFDTIVASSEVGHKKPNKEIFQKIIDLTGLSQKEIILCDDDEQNCNGAEEIGFIVHHYKELDKFKKELEAII